jgi:hypothetical protein
VARAAVVTPPPPSSPSVQKESVPLHTTYNQAAIERAPKISSFFQALLPVALRFRQKGHFDPRAEMMVDVWSEKLLTRDIKETSQKSGRRLCCLFFPFFFSRRLSSSRLLKEPWILSSSPYTYSDSLVAGHYAGRQATAISTIVLAHYRRGRMEGRTNGRS